MVEIKLRLSVSDARLIERAREVLAHAAVKARGYSHGSAPSGEDVIVAALNLLLDRKDPMRKAERAAETKIPAARQESVSVAAQPGIDNLALKCRRHNLLAAERSFGASFMGQFRNTN